MRPKPHRFMPGAIGFAILSALMLGLHIQGMFTSLDQVAFEWASAGRTDLLTAFLSMLTFFGEGRALAPLGVIVVLVCFFRGKHIEALVVFLTLLTAYVLNEGMKAYFARPRPTVFHLIDLPTSFSFPSGHAMVGPAFYLLLAAILSGWFKEKRFSSLIQPVAFLLVVLLAASRVYLGVHYISDVLCGFCLAMTFYFLARWALWRWSEQHREQVAASLHSS